MSQPSVFQSSCCGAVLQPHRSLTPLIGTYLECSDCGAPCKMDGTSVAPPADSFRPTTFLSCPLSSCAWVMAPAEPEGVVSLSAGGQLGSLLPLMREAATATEAVLKAHLETHDLLEWVQEIQSLRERAAGLVAIPRAALETVFGYARQFDADSDPSMQLVRASLETAR